MKPCSSRKGIGAGILGAVLALVAVGGLGAWTGLLPPARVLSSTPVRLPSDAYIWQRVWSDALVQAIRTADPALERWHVLASERDQRGIWHDAQLTAPPDGTLAQVFAAHPVLAVFRLSGRRADLDPAAFAAHITAVVAEWRSLGIVVQGIELDHDCATARLDAYARFIAALRPSLPPKTELSITALPAWLGSSALPELLGEADSAVLQLHAVRNPVEGLFSPVQARNAASLFGPIAARTLRSGRWWIALPSYGSRILWGQDGQVAAIESEGSQGIGPGNGQELIVAPRQIAAFMQSIEARPPIGLEGWIWFRLPVAGDRRSWSLGSWLSLVRHEPIREAMTLEAAPAGKGLYHIIVRNTGTVDALPPPVLHVTSPCRGAGAQGPYRLDYDRAGLSLTRAQTSLLTVGQSLIAAWLSCPQEEASIHVTP